jgi:two-component system, NarL family, invasion response regulator UvrY
MLRCHQAVTVGEAQGILEQELAVGLIVVAACIRSEELPSVVRSLECSRRPLPLIVISDSCSSEQVRRLIGEGALAVINGLDRLEELQLAVESALRGAMHISALARGHEGGSLGNAKAKTGSEALLRSLSDREMEIFELLGAGRCVKEIAGALGISTKTVETHKWRAQEKLGCKGAAQLSQLASTHVLRMTAKRNRVVEPSLR